MSENVLPSPRRAPRQAVAPNAVIGTLIFVVTELMLFAGFISAFTITRAAYNTWPPVGQPRLPAVATLVNSVALMASGVAIYYAGRAFAREGAGQAAKRWTLAALLLGSVFVFFQGMEWVALLREGLTLSSSNLGSFFYMIIGTHGLHAVVALGFLASAYLRIGRGTLVAGRFTATRIFWYFVVGVWPVLYFRVYL